MKWIVAPKKNKASAALEKRFRCHTDRFRIKFPVAISVGAALIRESVLRRATESRFARRRGNQKTIAHASGSSDPCPGFKTYACPTIIDHFAKQMFPTTAFCESSSGNAIPITLNHHATSAEGRSGARWRCDEPDYIYGVYHLLRCIREGKLARSTSILLQHELDALPI